MPHPCVSELSQHWFRWWLVAWSAPSHYLNQCWNIVDYTLRNKLQWKSIKNTRVFIHENVFENVVCEMATILSSGDELKNTWDRWRHETSPDVTGKVLHPRADSRFPSSRWETVLLCNDVSHWLCANLESTVHPIRTHSIDVDVFFPRQLRLFLCSITSVGRSICDHHGGLRDAGSGRL